MSIIENIAHILASGVIVFAFCYFMTDKNFKLSMATGILFSMVLLLLAVCLGWTWVML